MNNFIYGIWIFTSLMALEIEYRVASNKCLFRFICRWFRAKYRLKIFIALFLLLLYQVLQISYLPSLSIFVCRFEWAQYTQKSWKTFSRRCTHFFVKLFIWMLCISKICICDLRAWINKLVQWKIQHAFALRQHGTLLRVFLENFIS